VTKNENSKFVKLTETLVNPKDVTAISFLGSMNRALPLSLQRSMKRNGSKKTPYIGFIVDPYCFFLCYEIADVTTAEALIPPGYELTPVKVFDKDEERNLLLIGVFSARTSAFIGTRAEIYVIARNRESGLISWIIIDYETDTNSYDNRHGFGGYTTDKSIFTTTPYGELLIDIESRRNRNKISVAADLKQGAFQPLYEPLWIEGNLSIDYGKELSDEVPSLFSLVFDPVLMREALEIPLKAVQLHAMNLYSSIIDAMKPIRVVCFPYSQHYMIQNESHGTVLRNRAELEKTVGNILQKKELKTMAGADIKKPLFFGLLLMLIVNWGLILFLVLKLVL
jgi:hypothetical protein